MIRAVLFVFRLLSPVIRLLDADVGQFLAILEVKLTQDGRRKSAALQNSAGKSNVMVITMVLYVLMGLMGCGLVFMIKDRLAAMTIIYAFIFVMIGMSLIADFSSVLLDTSDFAIILPRPVSSRTLLIARIAHISTYLMMSTMALGAATLVTGTIVYGLMFAFVFPISLVILNGLIIFFVNVFYAAAIRLTHIERLKDVILYIQIVMSLALFLGYQILPRLIAVVPGASTADISGQWWTYLCPPAWIAGFVEVCLDTTAWSERLLAVEALVVCIAGIAVVARLLGPGFSTRLTRLEQPNARPMRPTSSALRIVGSRHPHQRAVFDWISAIVSRDRQFKLKFYPNMGMVLVLPFLFFFRSSGDESLATFTDGGFGLLLLYAPCMIAPALVIQLRYSEQCDAAWIYQALPFHRPGDILSGALRAVLCKYIVPLFLLILICMILLKGAAVLIDAPLALVAILLVCHIYAAVLARHLPFSEKPSVQADSGRLFRNLLLLTVPVALCLLHWGSLHIRYATALLLIVESVLLWLIARRYAATGWQAIRDH